MEDQSSDRNPTSPGGIGAPPAPLPLSVLAGGDGGIPGDEDFRDGDGNLDCHHSRLCQLHLLQPIDLPERLVAAV